MARYKIELDVRKPYMIWTPLDFHPPVARNSNPRPQVSSIDPPQLPAIYAVARPDSLLGDLRNNPPPPLPAYVGVELDGVAIAAIVKGSPAEKAGLKVGDVVTDIGLQPIRSADDIRKASPNLAAGRPVEIKVRRGAQPLAVTVTPVTAF
jgi:membrane-associated protease RseP (regulator of RpoE activity)